MNDGVEFLLLVALVKYLRDKYGDGWTVFFLIIAMLLSPVGVGFLTGLGVLH
jgi:hypothetical protein